MKHREQVRRGRHPPAGADPEERRGRDRPDRRAAGAVAGSRPAGRRWSRSTSSALVDGARRACSRTTCETQADRAGRRHAAAGRSTASGRGMRQVFQNLIDNAIKYMGDGPTQRDPRRLHGAADEAEFYVRDTGIGIEPEDLDKVFFVFRRGKNPAVQNVAGKGVGLASVKSIIETYSGHDLGREPARRGQHVPVHDQRQVRAATPRGAPAARSRRRRRSAAAAVVESTATATEVQQRRIDTWSTQHDTTNRRPQRGAAGIDAVAATASRSRSCSSTTTRTAGC